MRKHILALIAGLVLLWPPMAHASRVPSAKAAQSITHGFFKKYGHKYEDSIFGRVKISKVEILQVQEIARNQATVEAYVKLVSGESPRVLVTLKKTPPFGWSVISWEMRESL